MLSFVNICCQNPNPTTTQPNITKVRLDTKMTLYHHHPTPAENQCQMDFQSEARQGQDWVKTTFDEKLPLMKGKLRWKMILDGRQSLIEDDL